MENRPLYPVVQAVGRNLGSIPVHAHNFVILSDRITVVPLHFNLIITTLDPYYTLIT
jgi:hypothetical protein